MHYMEDPERRRAALEKARKSRAELGPRLGQPEPAPPRTTAEPLGVPSLRIRAQRGSSRGHPTRDSR